MSEQQPRHGSVEPLYALSFALALCIAVDIPRLWNICLGKMLTWDPVSILKVEGVDLGPRFTVTKAWSSLLFELIVSMKKSESDDSVQS